MPPPGGRYGGGEPPVPRLAGATARHVPKTDAPIRQPSLTSRTAGGFAWFMGQTVGTKIVNLAGNVVLAWLLLEKDFGLVGLAYTFTIVASLIQRGSVREVLVHRQASFRRWVNPAFWMAATMGVLSGLAMAASAPIAAHVYGDRQLIGIIGVLALAAPIQSLAVVTEAKLQNQFRFKLLASIALATTVMLIVSKVLLAWLGFGAYSFVLPEPFVHALRAAVLWWVVRPRIRLTPQFRRWRYLVGDSVTVLAANAAVTVALLGDCVVLGLWTSPAVVGVYYFALRNSSQTIHLFTHNVTKVLFPALSRLQGDVPRQTQAFLRASRALAVVGVPLCLLQAGVADPAVRLLFEPRWYAAIPVLQVLSVGMALRLVTEPSYSMLKAQGRFPLFLRLGVVSTVVYYAFAGVGVWRGGMLGVAVGVAAWLVVVGPIQLFLAIRPGGGRMRDVLGVYLAPCGAGALAVGLGVGAAEALPRSVPARDLARAIVTALVAIAAYLPLIRRFAPDVCGELRERLQPMLSWRRLRRLRDTRVGGPELGDPPPGEP